MFVRRFSFFNVCKKLLAPEGGAGTTGGEGTTGGTGTATGGSEGTGGAGEGTGNGEGSDGHATDGDNSQTGNKTFTQADLDRVVNERLARERKKYEGVDVKEYNRLKSEEDARVESQKTELEKAQDKLNKAELEKQQAIDLANKRLILAEFKVKAKDANIKYVDDAYRLSDLSTVEVKEDGAIEGIDAIIESLIKEKPFLLEDVKGGTGKIDDPNKQKKTNTTTSFGKRLAEMNKKENGVGSQRHYFK